MAGAIRPVVDQHVAIAMRDGVSLSAIVYRPPNQVPGPAIMSFSPYGAYSAHDVGMGFATRGLAFVSVDVRGRGNSDGVFTPMADIDRDARDAIDWLSGQPFCNGSVGLWGGSYSGYAQWAAIRDRSPALKTITPAASPYRGADLPLRGNTFSASVIRWLVLVSRRSTPIPVFADKRFWNEQFRRFHVSGLAFEHLDAFVGLPSRDFQTWIAHPEPGPFWHQFNPQPSDYRDLDIPVLTITGIYDADQIGAITHHREHLRYRGARGHQHHLVIGPWDHAGTRHPQPQFGGLRVGDASLVDLMDLHVQWYAWAMGDGERPDFLRDHVAYYLTDAEEWRYAPTLEAVTGRYRDFQLASATNPSTLESPGQLTEGPGSGGPDSYVHDPRDISRAAIEVEVDPDSLTSIRMIEANAGRQLIYETEAFAEAVEIAGFVELDLWLSIDQPDTDFRASLHEVSAAGSLLLTVDMLRARYREDEKQAVLIKTRDPLQYRFRRFPFTARRVAPGHRLRLVIAPVDSIFAQRNVNAGGEVAREPLHLARPVCVELFHDDAHPSSLRIPIAAGCRK